MIKNVDEIRRNLKELFAIEAWLNDNDECFIRFKKKERFDYKYLLGAFGLESAMENKAFYKKVLSEYFEFRIQEDNIEKIPERPFEHVIRISEDGLDIQNFKINIKGNYTTQKDTIETFIAELKQEINSFIETLIEGFKNYDTINEAYVEGLNISLND